MLLGLWGGRVGLGCLFGNVFMGLLVFSLLLLAVRVSFLSAWLVRVRRVRWISLACFVVEERG